MLRNKPIHHDLHLRYWQNGHQNNEFIRSIGDEHLLFRAPYTNLYIQTIPSEGGDDLYPYRYFFKHYHMPHIFKRKYVFETFLVDGKLNEQFGACTMDLETYNKMFPDGLQITLNPSDPLNHQDYIWAKANSLSFVDELNEFFRNDNYPYLKNLTFIDRNFWYQDKLGLTYYRGKMEGQQYFFYGPSTQAEKGLIFKNKFLDYFEDEIIEIKQLIFITNNQLGLLIENAAGGEMINYIALVIYYLGLFISFIGCLTIILINLLVFLYRFFKNIYYKYY